MPTPVKEYREFFFRHTQVSSGAKADQETGYPLQYSATIAGVIKTVYNRFLKNDYPSEGVFKKLYESITFKLNQEDTAKLAEQGLVKIATDANAETRTSPLSTTFTEAVVPHQLPDPIVTIDGATDTAPVVIGTDNGIKITSYRRTISGLFKRIFRFEVVVQDSVEIEATAKTIRLVNDDPTPGDGYAYMQTSGSKGWFDIFTYIATQISTAVTTLTTLINNTMPSGVILMWSGSIGTIPNGWVICDGTNSTPDLRDRFIVGAGTTYTVNDTGGSATVTLTAAQSGVPAHTHGPGSLGGTTGIENANHTHDIAGLPSVTYGDYADGVDSAAALVNGTVGTTSAESATHGHNFTVTTGDTAANSTASAASSHENRPPYYALAYIMKS